MTNETAIRRCRQCVKLWQRCIHLCCVGCTQHNREEMKRLHFWGDPLQRQFKRCLSIGDNGFRKSLCTIVMAMWETNSIWNSAVECLLLRHTCLSVPIHISSTYLLPSQTFVLIVTATQSNSNYLGPKDLELGQLVINKHIGTYSTWMHTHISHFFHTYTDTYSTHHQVVAISTATIWLFRTSQPSFLVFLCVQGLTISTTVLLYGPFSVCNVLHNWWL